MENDRIWVASKYLISHVVVVFGEDGQTVAPPCTPEAPIKITAGLFRVRGVLLSLNVLPHDDIEAVLFRRELC